MRTLESSDKAVLLKKVWPSVVFVLLVILGLALLNEVQPWLLCSVILGASFFAARPWFSDAGS
jgi:hypothetical protein